MGDINIDIKSNKDHAQNYLNLLSNQGFKSLINNYTRVHIGSQTCIDHIFLKGTENKNVTSFILKYDITDHFPVLALIEIGGAKSDYLNKKNNNTSYRLDELRFRDFFSKDNWDDFYSTNDINQSMDILVNKIKSAISYANIEIKYKTRYKKRHPWITLALMESVETKQKLYKAHKNDPENVEKATIYKNYKNKLNKLIYKTKTDYFQTEIRNSTDSKSLWQTINKFTGKVKEKNSISEIKFQNQIIHNKEDIANCFNGYFSNLGKNLASAIKRPKKDPLICNTTDHTIFLTPTDPNEIQQIILKLKLDKAPGIDGISTQHLRLASEFIQMPLVNVINQMFIEGIFPDILKVGLIKPLLKKGEPTEVSNYRPISLISNVSKIIEKILKKRIESFLERFQILSDNQFGFRTGMSTEDALVYLTKNIYNNLDNNKAILGVFLDLAKAFDTVDHEILIQKLENIGFRGSPLKLLTSYLSNRVQYVKIEDSISSANVVEYGVPQGTVLGPILFSIYINELFSLGSVGSISSFADDTVILYAGDSWRDVKESAEQDLTTVKTWFDRMSLTINFDKTNYIAFSCNKKRLPYYNEIYITQNQQTICIKETEHTKYLGIEIDNHLKWDKHINILIKKLRSILYKFKTLRQILTLNNLKTVYYSLVYSVLQYGIGAWGAAYKTHVDRLTVVQKFFIKTMYNKNRTYPSDLLYHESQLMDINQIFCFKIINLQYKNKHQLQKIDHPYNTRYKLDKQTKTLKANKTIGQRSYYFLAPHIYILIPEVIRNEVRQRRFKKLLKCWILSLPRSKARDFIDISN